VVMTTEFKFVSLGFGRFETCQGFFSIGTHLDIHSCIMSSVVHLTSFRSDYQPQSLSFAVSSKPVDNLFTVYRTEIPATVVVSFPCHRRLDL